MEGDNAIKIITSDSIHTFFYGKYQKSTKMRGTETHFKHLVKHRTQF